MIKVALVSPFTLPDYCGNSILAERLQKGLVKQGYEVALFNSNKNKSEQVMQFSPRIVHSFNAERTFPWMKLFRSSFTARWVITLTGTDYAPWCGIKDPPAHVKENLEHSDALIVFHEPAASSLSASLPMLKNKIYIIPQGIAPIDSTEDRSTIRTKYGIGQEATVFLMAGGIRPIKNLSLAIKVFYEVKKQAPEVILLHVGPVMDKEESDRVFALSENLSCFRSLGGLPPRDVRELMRAADVLMNTSFHEGMSGAILEAMAEGLPILASNAEGNLTLVQENINGFIFSVDDPQALTQRAIELACNPCLRKKMGEESKNLARQNYSEKKELDLHVQVYQGLLGNRT
ncbi:MAG: glycosyltransferase [Thermodesulfobacteriota bacterium]|jgi:glycosyltransferase involved in cell wall biosynthesis|nr:MAG: glycosyltransferase [Thermodesulfobacteriota bacterium]